MFFSHIYINVNKFIKIRAILCIYNCTYDMYVWYIKKVSLVDTDGKEN